MKAREQMETAGVRPTPERERLLEALARTRSPISSKDLHAKLGNAMDRVTVYRNLETFVKAGIARRVDLGHRHAHYEAADEEHHHLVCTRCGLVEDVAYCPDPRELRAVLARSARFASLERHALELFGTCADCARER